VFKNCKWGKLLLDLMGLVIAPSSCWYRPACPQVALSHSDRLACYSARADLNARMPGFRTRMGFGLHVGWAIEGPIGEPGRAGRLPLVQRRILHGR
jgi:hypothetical protein